MGKKVTYEQFLERAMERHGLYYSYVSNTYKGMSQYVTIICPEHGEFQQQAYAHTKMGHGCPKCKGDRISATKVTPFSVWQQRAETMHGNKNYSYDNTTYKNTSTKIRIVCPDHGEFYQTPEKHLLAEIPCPVCSKEFVYANKRLGASKIIDRARQAHGDRYIYQPHTIQGTKDKMGISCRKHGDFWQTPEKHIGREYGCPACVGRYGISKGEQSLYDFILPLAPDAIQSDRAILGGKELDIYVPSKNLAIEYCGVYWHSETFIPKEQHFEKWKACRDKGIRLLTVFEDEDSVKVRAAIRAALGVRQKGKSARQLELRTVDSASSKAFFDQYHLQGNCGKRVTLGLWNEDSLVAAMSFGAPSRQSKHDWELRRFATDGETHAGAASRLWTAFLREYRPTSVVSLSDRRWFDGAMYRALGFEWDGEVRPDYSYTKNGRRFHKSGFRKAGIRSRLPEFYDENLTEREMMENAGFARIWDCGKDRWIWKNTS